MLIFIDSLTTYKNERKEEWLMKIIKDSLSHKFLFYLDEHSERPDTENVVIFILRCAFSLLLVPFFSFLVAASGYERPAFFWEGNVYQKPAQPTLPLPRAVKTFLLMYLVIAALLTVLILAMIFNKISRIEYVD